MTIEDEARPAPRRWPHPPLSEAGQAAIAEGLPELAERPPWPSFARDPDYGSPAWARLGREDPAKLRAVVHAAQCWRLLAGSGHLEQLLAEYAEWMRRRDQVDTSHAIAALRETWGTDSYAAIDRRRYPPHGRRCLIGDGCQECGTTPVPRCRQCGQEVTDDAA